MSKKERIPKKSPESLTASSGRRVVQIRRASDNKIISEVRNGVLTRFPD